MVNDLVAGDSVAAGIGDHGGEGLGPFFGGGGHEVIYGERLAGLGGDNDGYPGFPRIGDESFWPIKSLTSPLSVVLTNDINFQVPLRTSLDCASAADER